MNKIKSWVKSLPEEVTLTKMDLVLTIGIGVLSGIIIGILTSPKGDRTMGCNNGNTENFYNSDCLDEKELD